MKNFMMLFIAVFLSAATLLPLNGNEGKKKIFPACSFSTKLEMNFPADTAFLLLYLEESSYNMQETKARIDAKEKREKQFFRPSLSFFRRRIFLKSLLEK